MNDIKLSELYAEHQGNVSDKWSLYLHEYDRAFSEYINGPIRLLEIGIQNGGSLDIWAKYFTNAEKLVGCDINPDCANIKFDDKRIKIVIGDANQEDICLQLLDHAKTFDVIIDDGSHSSSDIIRSFGRYFKYLNEGGLFVIEDLHCSYWKDFEGSVHGPLTSISFLKRLIDIVNHEHWRNGKPRESLVKEFVDYYGLELTELDLSEIHSIEFVNSLCFIKKRTVSDNIIGSRIIAGIKENSTSNWHSLHLSSVEDMSLEIVDDETRDVFNLEKNLVKSVVQIATLNREVEEKLADIINLDRVSGGKISDLEKQALDHQIQIDKMSREILGYRNTVEMLESSVTLLESLMIQMQQTLSWRLTAPLRYVKKLLR